MGLKNRATRESFLGETTGRLFLGVFCWLVQTVLAVGALFAVDRKAEGEGRDRISKGRRDLTRFWENFRFRVTGFFGSG